MNVPIIPPPDLRNIVDKAALFVARNGPEFESRIQQNEQSNPKFNFLKIGDPYNAYYQFKVREIREGGGTAASTNNQALSNGEANKSTVSAQPTTNLVQSKLIRSFAEKVQIVPKEPPPEYEFTIEPPSMLAQDLDIIKLTAQFVAIHGRSFLTSLMNKEQRNYQFDFLRPQHGLFSYFSQLIEQYTKIINQAGEILEDLHRELEPDVTWRRVKYRYEWTKIKEAEKQKEQEEIERERLQYAQIDWHDFVVVETVDYQINEQGIFPPPTTPEQVGSRVLHQQRVEEEHMKEKQLASTGELDAEANGDLKDAETNGEDEAEQQRQKDRRMMPPPTSLNNVVIRKDYDPRQAKKQATSGTAGSKLDGWVISPITNEKISAEKLAEHMRYGLLDPRWVEQREKAMQEKLQQEEVFAPGVSIESSLKQMAERRTDIFGVGIDETEIGKKIGEEEVKTKDKVTWDGYSSSAEATARAARTNISIEDQIQQIHKIKGLVEEENKQDKIGPAFVPPTSGHSNSNTNVQMPSKSNIGQTNKQQMQPMQTNQPHQMPASQQAPRLFMPPSMPPAGLHHPAAPPMHPGLIPGHLMSAPQQFPPISNPMLGLHYPPMPPMPHGLPQHVPPHSMPSLPPFMAPGHPPPPAPLDEPSEPTEPAAKKQRTEDSLVPEEEWLASHSGTLSLNVSVPNMPEKPELNLNGQTLAVTLNLTDMVSVIKSKINEQLGLAPGKQKLQYEGIFIKDSNTLAFYNMMEGSIIQLALKERGGKKK